MSENNNSVRKLRSRNVVKTAVQPKRLYKQRTNLVQQEEVQLATEVATSSNKSRDRSPENNEPVNAERITESANDVHQSTSSPVTGMITNYIERYDIISIT
jgi:hypothetical protein